MIFLTPSSRRPTWYLVVVHMTNHEVYYRDRLCRDCDVEIVKVDLPRKYTVSHQKSYFSHLGCASGALMTAQRTYLRKNWSKVDCADIALHTPSGCAGDRCKKGDKVQAKYNTSRLVTSIDFEFLCPRSSAPAVQGVYSNTFYPSHGPWGGGCGIVFSRITHAVSHRYVPGAVNGWGLEIQGL